MSALYLRFAGPFQSWAGPRVAGDHVNTELRPTRSGTLGVLAAALGVPKDNWPRWISEIELQLREDNSGVVQRDFQTINPRSDNQEFANRIWKASGNKRNAPSFTPNAVGGTSIVIRTYLAGAEFLVRVQHDSRLGQIARACVNPTFSPYLGRKAFAPSFPFVLGVGGDDLLGEAPTASANGLLSIRKLDKNNEGIKPESIAVPVVASLNERLIWWRLHATIPSRVNKLQQAPMHILEGQS